MKVEDRYRKAASKGDSMSLETTSLGDVLTVSTAREGTSRMVVAKPRLNLRLRRFLITFVPAAGGYGLW